ncbi:hypothetical protein BH11PAT1_BH11PAT1_4250 [soil metagenome]
MYFVPKNFPKIQFLKDVSFPLVELLCQKTASQMFIGGRKGLNKEVLFKWLLVKKVTNWSYRTIASMAGVSHPTLIRANDLFLRKGIYEKIFTDLVKKAFKTGLIKAHTVAMDSSFVHTFSKRGELGSEGWNGHKEGFGFKLHLLIDAQTNFPISLKITNGNAHDSTLAVPLLKKARAWLRKTKYVLADKGYDSSDIVGFIAKELQAKAGIPIKKHKRGKNYSWVGSWNNFHQKSLGRTLKKSIYKKRSSIERVFSVLKRTNHLGHEEMRGILNFAKNVYLALISYMLKLFNITKTT